MQTTNPVKTPEPIPAKRDGPGLLSSISILAIIISGAYWALTNRVYAECQSIWIQASNPATCGRVLTWHPLAGWLAIGGIVVLAIAGLIAHGNRR